jgi:hypothetical protein
MGRSSDTSLGTVVLHVLRIMVEPFLTSGVHRATNMTTSRAARRRT